jgi:hypothetical protein
MRRSLENSNNGSRPSSVRASRNSSGGGALATTIVEEEKWKQ